MKKVKREAVDVSGKQRKTVKAPSKGASFGVLAFCLAVMGFVVKKGMDLDKAEAEKKIEEQQASTDEKEQEL